MIEKGSADGVNKHLKTLVQVNVVQIFKRVDMEVVSIFFQVSYIFNPHV